jgi:hypothetical protein
MRGFTTCTLRLRYYNNEINDDGMGGIRRTSGEMEVDKHDIKWILKETVVILWIGFIWLGIVL